MVSGGIVNGDQVLQEMKSVKITNSLLGDLETEYMRLNPALGKLEA